MSMKQSKPWALQQSRQHTFPLSVAESSTCTPFSLSSLMNARPVSTETLPFLFPSLSPLPIIPTTSSHDAPSMSYDNCARICEKPLSACRLPETSGTTQRASKTTSHIVVAPSKKRASSTPDVRAFKRSSLCPTRRWHNVGASRKSMYVICEEDEHTFAVPPTPPNTLSRRPSLKRHSTESSVPITSAVPSDDHEWAGRYVRFAHMVVEVRLPAEIEDSDHQSMEELEDDEADSEVSSQTDSISSVSTGSEPDLDFVLIEEPRANTPVPQSQKQARRPASRLSKLLRGYY